MSKTANWALLIERFTDTEDGTDQDATLEQLGVFLDTTQDRVAWLALDTLKFMKSDATLKSHLDDLIGFGLTGIRAPGDQWAYARLRIVECVVFEPQEEPGNLSGRLTV